MDPGTSGAALWSAAEAGEATFAAPFALVTTSAAAPGPGAPIAQGVVDTIPGSTATAATVAVGGSNSGVIGASGDHDWFRVELTAGTSYNFNLNSAVVFGASAIGDSYLRLRDANGVLLAENDDANGGTFNSLIRFNATTTGTYYLDAAGYLDPLTGLTDTGGYSIAAAVAPPIPIYTVDQVVDYLTTGYWGGPVAHWAANSTITYNVQNLTAAAQTLARAAFAAWQDVINLTFVETASGGQITLDDNQAGAFATSNSAGGITTSATVNVQQNWSGEVAPGLDSYTYQTFIHEIGHTLGLGHGGPYNGNATYGVDNIYQNDTYAMSVMSYFDQSNYNSASERYVMSPMMADIVAVQNLYGVRTATRNGDTTYGHNASVDAGAVYNFNTYVTAPSYTIWDGGGTDTLDASQYSDAQTVNLGAETSSSIGGLRQNIHIARNVIIENAIGGHGADTITGNAAANVIYGGLGHDILSGGSGADSLYGGDGDDAISGDGGADFMYGGFGDDRFVVDTYAGEAVVENANGGTDVVYAHIDYTVGLNIEQIIMVEGSAALNAGGGADANVIIGNSAANVIYGYGGDDVISGGDGADSILGGDGNDAMDGQGGTDQMIGGLGNDSYVINAISDVAAENANEGIDTVYAEINYTLSGNLEQLILREGSAAVNGAGDNGDNVIVGNSAANLIYGNDGADTIYGLAGADSLLGNGGSDVLDSGQGNDVVIGGSGADQFKFIVGDGADTVNDFSHAEGDHMLISTAMSANFADLIANHSSVIGGNVTLSFAGGQVITMVGIGSTGSLVAGDFVFF